MRWPSKDASLRIFLPPILTAGIAVPGVWNSETAEKVIFGVAVAALLLYSVYQFVSDIRKIESPIVRRRCKHILRTIHEIFYRSDDTFRATLFLPDRLDGDPILRPVVRFDTDSPEGYEPTSKAKFRTNSSSIIKQAWGAPGTLEEASIPCSDFKSDDVARGWFQLNFDMPESEAKRLSERTLRRVTCIAVVALSIPEAGSTPKNSKPLALVSFDSENRETLKPPEEKDESDLSEYLENVALLINPFPK